MKNILKACFIGCFEIVFLFFVLKFAKDRGVDLKELSISSILAQLIGMLFVPLVCLLVCRKEVRASFPIRNRKLLVLLSLCYCAFFFLRRQFNMLGIYIFVQDLLIVGFFEEYMYRGLLYPLIKRENKYLAIILSGMFWGISHAVYPTVLSGGGISAFVSAVFSNIGMGLAVGYGFIYLLESSNTLWMPILIHGLYDYSMGYGWIFFWVRFFTFTYIKSDPYKNIRNHNAVSNASISSSRNKSGLFSLTLMIYCTFLSFCI